MCKKPSHKVFCRCIARVCGSLMVAYSPDENIHKVAMVMCI